MSDTTTIKIDGPSTSDRAPVTKFGLSILDDASASDVRTTLDVQTTDEILEQVPVTVSNVISAPVDWGIVWEAAVANSANEPARLLIIGDSIATGAFAGTTGFNDGWVGQLKADLCGADNSNLSAEYIPALMHNSTSVRGSFTDMPWSDPVALSPTLFTTTGWHSQYYFADTAVELMRFTVPYDCENAFLYVHQHSGTFDYQINAASRVTITAPSATLELRRIELGALSEGDLVKVGWQSGGNLCRPQGITLVANASSGISIARFTCGGAQLVTMAQSGATHTPGTGGSVIHAWAGADPQDGNVPVTDYSYGFPTQPHCVIFSLGANDAYGATGHAVFMQTLDQACTGIRRGVDNCSILFLITDYPDQDFSDATSKMFTPAAPTVAVQGTPGVTAYKIKYSWESAYGTTIAGAVFDVTTGPATINETDFLRVTLPAAPHQALYVRVYVSDDAGSTWSTQQFSPSLTVDFISMASIVVPPATNTSFLPGYLDWHKYVEAMYTVANKHGCAVVNCGASFGSNAYDQDLMNGLDVHPAAAGHDRMFELVKAVINPD